MSLFTCLLFFVFYVLTRVSYTCQSTIHLFYCLFLCLANSFSVPYNILNFHFSKKVLATSSVEDDLHRPSTSCHTCLFIGNVTHRTSNNHKKIFKNHLTTPRLRSVLTHSLTEISFFYYCHTSSRNLFRPLLHISTLIVTISP